METALKGPLTTSSCKRMCARNEEKEEEEVRIKLYVRGRWRRYYCLMSLSLLIILFNKIEWNQSIWKAIIVPRKKNLLKRLFILSSLPEGSIGRGCWFASVSCSCSAYSKLKNRNSRLLFFLYWQCLVSVCFRWLGKPSASVLTNHQRYAWRRLNDVHNVESHTTYFR